jgi:hypothetical protein
LAITEDPKELLPPLPPEQPDDVPPDPPFPTVMVTFEPEV